MGSRRKQQRETRFERWLVELAEALGAQGWYTRLGYDDRHRGDRLYLVMAPPATAPSLAHLELQLERKKAKSAVIRLFADNLDHLALLHRALDGLHRQIRRLDNAKRKFIHRVERMVVHLHASFEQRRGGYPASALSKLQRLFPAATAQIGLEGSHRAQRALSERERIAAESGAEAGAEGLPAAGAQLDPQLTRKARRYRPAFAASVPVGGQRRSARYRPRRGFFLGREALALAQQQLATIATKPGDLAIANTIELPRQGDQDSSTLETVVDVADAAADAGACAVDCDWFDLPDCDVCSVPDCG